MEEYTIAERTEDNKQYVRSRYPDARLRIYAKLSLCIWSNMINERISGFFRNEEEAWSDAVTWINKDMWKNLKK